MKIKPSTYLRNKYNSISQYCKENSEPVYLTKNGEGDLVVMSIEAYEHREEMLDLREKLLEAEQERVLGSKTYNVEELNERLERIINEK